MEYVIVAVMAYLIGSIPSAFLIVKLLTGRDIRTLGTGNVGVMNTVRQAGLPAGMLAFIGEGSKGIAALGVARALVGTAQADSVAVIMALLGVNWSMFMRFAGGRGTTIVVFSALMLLWPVVVTLGVVWLVVYRLTRDNFIATRVNIVVLPFVTAGLIWAMDGGWGNGRWAYVSLAALGSVVTLLRHRRATDDHYVAAAARVHSPRP